MRVSKRCPRERMRAVGLPAVLRDPLFWTGLALFAYYLVWVAARPEGIFWSLDEGGKYIYLRSVLQTGRPGAPLIYPARALDPELAFVPLFFSIRQGGELYSWWPVGFPLLTIPPYMLFGWLGLYLIPAACGALCAVLVGAIIRRLTPPRRWQPTIIGALITGLATPVAFYAATFWEHTANACLVVLALWAVVRAWTLPEGSDAPWLAIGGAAASLATFFRVDALPIAFGFGLVILVTRRWRALWYAGAFGATTAGWLLVTRALTGLMMGRNWGPVAESPFLSGVREGGIWFISQALFNVPAVGAFDIPKPLLAVGTVAAILAVLAPLSRRARRLFAPAYLGVLGACAWVLLHPEGYRSVHGFLLIAPHVACASWSVAVERDRGGPPIVALAASATFCYSVAYVARAWPAAGGLQWGPRYMLALYPLLVIASIHGLQGMWSDRQTWARGGLAILFALGVLVGMGYQVRGLTAAHTTVRYYQEDAQAILQLESQPIVTPCTWFPMVVPRFYEQGNMLDIARSGLEAWEAAANETSIAQYAYVEIDSCSTTPLDELAVRRSLGTGITVRHVTVGPDDANLSRSQ